MYFIVRAPIAYILIHCINYKFVCITPLDSGVTYDDLLFISSRSFDYYTV